MRLGGRVYLLIKERHWPFSRSGAARYDGEMPLGWAGRWSLSYCRTSTINPELLKHASICLPWRVLLPSPFRVWCLCQWWPDLPVPLHPSPPATPPSLWHHLKPCQKVNPRNLCTAFTAGGHWQESAASPVPEEQSLSIYASGKCIF